MLELGYSSKCEVHPLSLLFLWMTLAYCPAANYDAISFLIERFFFNNFSSVICEWKKWCVLSDIPKNVHLNEHVFKKSLLYFFFCESCFWIREFSFTKRNAFLNPPLVALFFFIYEWYRNVSQSCTSIFPSFSSAFGNNFSLLTLANRSGTKIYKKDKLTRGGWVKNLKKIEDW